ncbi:MAG TPA: hypothetical protein VMY77_03210 [Chitinophagaceae bacterium]|nr:hypothetical protein [Chitinophagaceae bacterium]
MKKIILSAAFCISLYSIHAQDNVNREAKPALTQWAIKNNYSKSNNGQLLITLPAQAALNCIVNRAGEEKTFALRNDSPKELAPGSYDVTFWGIKIPSVTVDKRMDTRILAGVLNSTVRGAWEVWTTDGTRIFSAGGPKQVALPAGNYIVKTGGAEIKTAITDGKISIFSITRY